MLLLFVVLSSCDHRYKNLNIATKHNEICESFLKELSNYHFNYNDSLIINDIVDSIYWELYKDSGITKESLDSSRMKSRNLRESTTCDILKSSGCNYSAEDMCVYAKIDEALASYSKNGDFRVFKINLDTAKVKAKKLSYFNECCANAIINLAEESVKLWEGKFDGESTEKYMNIADCAAADINTYQEIMNGYRLVKEAGGKVKINVKKVETFVAHASICAYLDIDFYGRLYF